MAEAGEGIRWGRAVLAAVVVEIVLAIVAVPVFFAVKNPNEMLNLLVPPASFVVALLIVRWLFANAARPIASGIATGVSCVLLYVLLGIAAYLVAPDQIDMSQSLGVPYLASHALKILGGAAGGWWVARGRSTIA